jgi:hypothetical protein
MVTGRSGGVRLVAAVALLGLGAATAQQPADGGGHSHQTRKPGLPARAGLGSSAAFDAEGSLWLVGVDEQRRLFTQTSRDDGRNWSAPRRTDIGADQPAAEGDSRPKLAIGPAGLVVIAYTQPLEKPYTGLVRLLRSTDGGRTFSAPITVHHDRQPITHRFESIVFDANGRLHAVWVDKRDAELMRAAGSDKPRYTGAAIYRTTSDDGGATFRPETKVADHSCECCRIALVAEPNGAVVAMWRHVFAPNIRDHAFARIEAQSMRPPDPVRATFDDWRVDACPHHGPGLARAADGGFHTVWFGERAGQPAVRYSRLTSDGRPAGAVQVVPDERAEHADVLSAGQRVVIVWRSFDGKATRLRAQVSGDDGRTFELRELASAADDNDHPRLVHKGSQIYCVWRTKNEIRVIPVAP